MKASMKKPILPGHTMESPFPMKIQRTMGDGTVVPLGVVIDEMCACGHKRSEHADTSQFGHGGLMSAPNLCKQFTWAKFITID